jgi:hypothetical protein
MKYESAQGRGVVIFELNDADQNGPKVLRLWHGCGTGRVKTARVRGRVDVECVSYKTTAAGNSSTTTRYVLRPGCVC